MARKTQLLAGVLGVFTLALAIVWFARRSPGASGAPELSVAAASDLRYALDEITDEFRRKHPQLNLRVTYGSSGNFFAQLSNRAPFDVYMSADVDYPRKLAAGGLTVKDSEFPYAVGRLAVWAPKSSGLDVERLGLAALAEPSVKKVAIANPKHAPYGRAAQAALERAGLYEEVRPKLVFGENIAQTAQFVETGAADVGVVALSLALAPSLRDKGRFYTVPLDAHPRLDQAGVIMSWARDVEAAQAFRAFVIGAEGRAVLGRYGFTLP
jgi:molybdate transport system substrate-binding protein